MSTGTGYVTLYLAFAIVAKRSETYSGLPQIRLFKIGIKVSIIDLDIKMSSRGN